MKILRKINNSSDKKLRQILKFENNCVSCFGMILLWDFLETTTEQKYYTTDFQYMSAHTIL